MRVTIAMSEQIVSDSERQPATEVPGVDWLELVRRHAGALKFGTVLITVHDSRVIQVDRSEKVRFDGTKQSSGGNPSRHVYR